MKKLFTSVLTMLIAMTAMAQQLTYEVTSYCGKYYEGYSITIDGDAVQEAIGCTVADASAFVVLPDGTESETLLGGTDGWRNAAGEFQSWGSDAYYYVQADFSRESGQIYGVGGYQGNTAEPATYTANFKLYNPDDNTKSIGICVKLNYVEVPTILLSELTEITPRKTLTITQYPRNNTATTDYEVDLSSLSSLKNLGIDFANADIADYLFVKQMDPDLLIAMDELTLQSDCWFQELYDADGNELEECCYDANDQDTYAKFQYYDFSFDGDTLRFTATQNPGVLQADETYKVLLYVVNPETKKYVQLTIKLNIEKNPIEEVPYAQMKMVGEEDIKLTRQLSLGYTTENIEIDIDKIVSLFSYENISAADLVFKALMDGDEELTDSYTTSSGEYGFWMDLNSHPISWDTSTQSYFVNSVYALTSGYFTIGHMPNVFDGGEKATGYLFFTYGQEYYRFNMDITFGEEADPEDATPDESEVVATLSYEYQIIPNSESYQDDWMASTDGQVDVDIDWVESQIGTSTPDLYGWKEVTDDESGDTYLAYSKNYSCDPQPGFWMIEPTGEYQFNTATVGTWGTNAFGICYASGVFQFFQFPGQRSVGDVYDADFFLHNPKTAQMVKIHFTVSYVESRQSVNVVGTSSYPVEAGYDDPVGTEIENLEDIYAALGCDAAEFELAGNIMASKTNTTYVDKDNGYYDDTYEGFPFNADGFVVDPNTNPEDVTFYLGVNELGEIMATVLDEALLADGKTLTGRLAFDYGESRYVLVITLCADPTGVSKITVKTEKAGNIYDLSGRLVTAPAKGLYIQNGQKILVK